MPYYEDLTTIHPSGRLVTVGWLSPEEDFPRGEVDEDVFARLVEFAANPWQPSSPINLEYCGFCRFTGGPGVLTYRNMRIQIGTNSLYIPDIDYIFVAPSLLLHYIDAHGYQPPDPFCAAVHNCPSMRSAAYFHDMLHAGLRDVFPSCMGDPHEGLVCK